MSVSITVVPDDVIMVMASVLPGPSIAPQQISFKPFCDAPVAVVAPSILKPNRASPAQVHSLAARSRTRCSPEIPGALSLTLRLISGREPGHFAPPYPYDTLNPARLAMVPHGGVT